MARIFTQEHRRRLSEAKRKNPLPRLVGSRNPNWKGENAGYVSKHIWVAKWFGRPEKCETCQTTKVKKYEWANKSGEHKRVRSDWIRLCTKCHLDFDGHGLANIARKNPLYFNRWSGEWQKRRQYAY